MSDFLDGRKGRSASRRFIELVPLDDLLAAGGDYLDEDERRSDHLVPTPA